MQRRIFIKWSSLLGTVGLLPAQNVFGESKALALDKSSGTNDRAYWVSLLDKIASPVLSNISKGELRKNMELQVSPHWGNANKEVAYLEAFGRLIAGMAPWFNLPQDNTAEGKIRKRLHEQTLQGIANGFDPQNPDYFCWAGHASSQPLVDAAYVAHALIRAPKALWEPLSETTKKQVIHEFIGLRQITPGENNWVLFAAMVESFLLSIGIDVAPHRIDHGIDAINGWYLGDGWYADGKYFHFDHYNSYVIHPMLLDILRINVDKGRRPKAELDLALKRMKRSAQIQERYISPEGTYPVIGRSSTYRIAVFQGLAQMALEDELTPEIEPAQVRCGITAVMKRIYIPSTFTSNGWLTLGFIGDKQINIADSYSNTGSMYMSSLAFLPLGLPASHKFWSGPFTDWTSRKAWSGQVFNIDHGI